MFDVEFCEIPEQVEWFWLNAADGHIPWLYVEDDVPYLGEYVVDKGSEEWVFAADPADRALFDLAVIATHRSR